MKALVQSVVLLQTAWMAVIGEVSEGESAAEPAGKPIAAASNIRFQGLVMCLHRVKLTEDGWRLLIGFHNVTRLPIEAYGLLNEEAAWLEPSTGGDRLPCLKVDGRLESYLPKGGLAPGEAVLGTLLFQTKEHKNKDYQLHVNGFKNLKINLHESLVTTASPVDGIADWLTGMNRDVGRRDLDRLIRRAEPGSEAEKDLAVFLRGFETLPLTDCRWVLAGRQEVKATGDGRLEGLVLRFEHGLKGLAADNRFATIWRCDLVGDAEGGWLLTEIRYEGAPPFWVLGYTGIARTDHFYLIYRPDTESAEALGRSARQVESAYIRLKARKLALNEQYVAFFVPFREDFARFTGRTSGHYNGAVSAMQVREGGELREFNRAMFINDHHFLIRQRALNLGDRQKTVTHELVHLAMAEWTRPWTPPWLVEGLAVVDAGQLTPDNVRALGRAGLLRRISLVSLMKLGMDVGGGDPRFISAQYIFSGLAVEILLRRFGRQSVHAFYQAFAKLPDERIEAELEAIREDDPGADRPELLRRVRLRLTVELLPEHFEGLTLVQLDQLTRFQSGR